MVRGTAYLVDELVEVSETNAKHVLEELCQYEEVGKTKSTVINGNEFWYKIEE